MMFLDALRVPGLDQYTKCCACVPSSQFPVPSSQFPVPSSQFLVPAIRYSYEDRRYDLPPKTAVSPTRRLRQDRTLVVNSAQDTGSILGPGMYLVGAASYWMT